MRSSGWLILIALGPTVALGFGNGCKFRADRAGGVDAKGVEKVVIRAGAGDMKVVGRGEATSVEARGVACAATQKVLNATQINVRREGNVVYVETALPENANGWSFGMGDYASLDIGIALPTSIPVEATDSSGDARFEDLKTLTLKDSSGDLELRRIAGLADVDDSSGDLTIDNVGAARVRDTSGDVVIDEVHGDVDVIQDSAGDIRVSHAEGNVHVGQDSSGDIRVEDVKGNFTVDADSSGDIFARDVRGDFTVKSDGSGSIEHTNIGGKVAVPDNHRD